MISRHAPDCSTRLLQHSASRCVAAHRAITARPRFFGSQCDSHSCTLQADAFHVGHEECLSGTYLRGMTLAVEFLYFPYSGLL